MKIGLVLGGGAMRGMYSAGVLDVFMENDIEFDGVIGVSAGSLAGCSFMSKQIGRTYHYTKDYCNDSRFMSLSSFFKTGDIIGADFCYNKIPNELVPFDYETYHSSSVPFYVTVTNMNTGEPEYIQIKDMKTEIDYMRASASMPYVSRIVSMNHKDLSDGDWSDCIPVLAFKEMGYEKNVVILTQPLEFMDKKDYFKLFRYKYLKYPNFIDCLENRSQQYNQKVREVKELLNQNDVYVICPQKSLPIQLMTSNPDLVQKTYEIGREDGLKHLENLNEWLNSWNR